MKTRRWIEAAITTSQAPLPSLPWARKRPTASGETQPEANQTPRSA